VDVVEILLKIQKEYKNGAMAYKSVFGVDHKSALDKAEAIEKAIKALEDQPKYEAALKIMANENIPDNSYQFCDACINEDTSRSPYASRVCQLYEGGKGVIYTNECGRAAIVYYKKKAGLEVD
jgi:hypothetical protein